MFDFCSSHQRFHLEQWLTPKRAELFPASNSGRIIAGWLRCSWIGVTSSTTRLQPKHCEVCWSVKSSLVGKVCHVLPTGIPSEKASRSYPYPWPANQIELNSKTKHLLIEIGGFQFISMLLAIYPCQNHPYMLGVSPAQQWKVKVYRGPFIKMNRFLFHC